MTLADYRNTSAWHAALDLGPHLIRLAEQLPDGEATGMGAQLRLLAVEVPASIATDLVTASTTALTQVLRTVAALEVIERVYPALDTAEPRAAADALASRVNGASFGEFVAGTASAEEAATIPAGDVTPTEPAVAIAAPAEASEPAAPVAVPVDPVIVAPQPAPAAPAPLSVAITTEAPAFNPGDINLVSTDRTQ